MFQTTNQMWYDLKKGQQKSWPTAKSTPWSTVAKRGEVFSVAWTVAIGTQFSFSELSVVLFQQRDHRHADWTNISKKSILCSAVDVTHLRVGTCPTSHCLYGYTLEYHLTKWFRAFNDIFPLVNWHIIEKVTAFYTKHHLCIDVSFSTAMSIVCMATLCNNLMFARLRQILENQQTWNIAKKTKQKEQPKSKSAQSKNHRRTKKAKQKKKTRKGKQHKCKNPDSQVPSLASIHIIQTDRLSPVGWCCCQGAQSHLDTSQSTCNFPDPPRDVESSFPEKYSGFP